MLFQHFEGVVVRRLEIPTRKTALGEIDLHLGIVRRKLGGFLEQQMALRKLSLVVVDGGQFAYCRRIAGG